MSGDCNCKRGKRGYRGLDGLDGLDLERDHLKYTVLLSQVGTSNPTDIVLGVNTIGNIVWTRVGVGRYNGTLTGAFPLGITWFNIQLMSGDSIGSVYEVIVVRVSDNIIRVTTSDGTDTLDEVLNNTSIEVRVYN